MADGWMRLWFGVQDAGFYCMLAMDFLLVASVVFSILYAACLLFRRVFPRRVLSTRLAGLTLFLALAAVPLALSPAGDAVAVLMQVAAHAALLFPGEGVIPNVPVLIWLAGVAASGVFLTRDIIRIRRWTRTAPVVASSPAFERAKAELGLGKTVRLHRSPPGVPAASWGVFSGCVFIPEEFASGYSDEEQYYIFLHELVHIRRMDTVKCLCARVAEVVFWFHPLVRLAARNVLDAVEIACDAETVRRAGVRPLRYARLIVRAHASAAAGAPLPAFSSAYADGKRRIGHILGDMRLAAEPLRRLLLPAVFLAVVAGAAVFCLQPARDLVHSSGQIMDAPVIMTAPNGERIEIVTRFQWTGALGSYYLSDARTVE